VKYLLDTNVCIKYLTQRSASVVARIRSFGPSEIALCSVVKSELLYGAHKSARADENLEKLKRFFEPFVAFPFDDAAAGIAGDVRAGLDGLGTPIGPNDLLIAATALANGLTLVTHNLTEFGRVSGLALEDWEGEP
jgi:tRNA(fMet)-specific endonuclease VapC